MTNRWQRSLFPLLLACGCSADSGPVTASTGNVGADDAGSADDAGQVAWPDGDPDDGEGDDGEPDPREDAGADAEVPTGPTLAMDHVQMRGTHNSYHQAPSIAFDASHKYTHAPLDVQLGDQGVRTLELDLHRANSDDSIDVYHITTIDSGTSCLNFEECLRTLRGWSEAHPTHAPVVVWVEVKDDTGGPAFSNLDKVDSVLREELGARLLTPDDIQGTSASLHEAIRTRGWPRLDDVRGKFLFVILSNDEDIDRYTEGYTTTAGRLMFPRVGADRFASPVAAFAKLGIGEPDVVTAAHAEHLMIATNVCSVNEDDAVCEQSRLSAIAQGFHMLKDDLPAPIGGRTYFMALPEGKPVACNPVRSPAGCTPEALEAL